MGLDPVKALPRAEPGKAITMAEQEQSRLEKIEARRAERKAADARAAEEQRATDLEAIDALEVEHGDSNIDTLRVPFTPGLPTLVACRCPSSPEMKRFRSRVKPTKGDKPVDYVAPTEELALTCLVYPDRETFEKVCEARPGLMMQVGTAALKLGTAEADAAGKD